MVESQKKANSIDVYVGGRVRYYRQMRSMTQAELAKELNVTLQQINKYESGHIRMAGSTIVKICNVLSCHIFGLFEQYMVSEEEAIKGPEGQRIRSVIKCYNEMNREKRMYSISGVRV